MKIVHFAPFAPCACGLYEAARDMMIADKLSGHDAYMVDTGITRDGKKSPAKIDAKDKRGETEISTQNPIIVFDADVIIAHTGIPDQWIVQCQAPIVWILHGRPAACFRPEQFGNRNAYSLTARLAIWPRVKAMVTFWDYHVQYWKPIIPEDKLVCFPAPPIDEKRFSKDGHVYDYKTMGGECNIMIAESWREDVDIYEITFGVIAAAKILSGVKFHFYAMESPLRCWNFLIEEMRRLGIKGEIFGRRTKIEEVYRAADILLSPQRITTRSVGEALSCGTPVIAAKGCDSATWNMIPDEPENVAETIKEAILDLVNKPDEINKRVEDATKAFSLSEYNNNMNRVYEKILQ